MKKDVSKMSLQELWRLFPIVLEAPNRHWKEWFEEEKTAVEKILPCPAWLSHIGSTAIGGIWAKPIVDILAELPVGCDMAACKAALVAGGWRLMAEEEGRASFNKGYTEEGFAEQVFHLHLRYAGDNDELYFRDYLMEYPSVAKEYEQLKLLLWPIYEFDRDEYTAAKTEFVREYTEKAKAEYGDKYE